MLLYGCSVQIRGNYMNLMDDTLALETIGFLQSRNAHLSRDCITVIDPSDNSIEVIIPFDTDLNQDLVVYFTTTADPGISVLNSDTDQEWISNETTLSFTSNTISYPVKLTSQYSSTGSPATREYTLYIKKFFKPELTQKNWAAANTSGAIDLVFEFRDENNSPLASGIDWIAGSSVNSLSYDDKVQIENYNPTNSSGKFQGLSIKQEIPGVSTVFIPNSHFKTTDGRFQATGDDRHPEDSSITGTLLTFTFMPSSAVYLSSDSGDDSYPKAGFNPSTPAKTWNKIINILEQASKEQFQYIYVAKGDYDTKEGGRFKNTGSWISIIGGWNSDFTTQDNSSDKSTFHNSLQLKGEKQPSGVFEYIATAVDMSQKEITLSNITIKVNPDSGRVLQNSTALLVYSLSDKPHTVSLNNVQCKANEGTDTYGVYIKNTNVEVNNSSISGGNGTNLSCALYFEGDNQLTIDNSDLSGGNASAGDSKGIEITAGSNDGIGNVRINNSKIISGQSAEKSHSAYGIDAIAVGKLEIQDSSILAGFKSWGSQGQYIDESYGLKFTDATTVSLVNVWIHSTAIGYQAVSVHSESANDSVSLTVDRSTLIAENATNTHGMVFKASYPELSTISMQNSVIHIDKGGNGKGIIISSVQELNANILYNTILINGETELIGIDVQSSLNDATILRISNNTFYSSHDSLQLQGIKAVSDLSSSNISAIPGVYTIHHNNFWASGGVEFVFSMSTNGTYTLQKMQSNSNDIFKNNVSKQVDVDNVDMIYNYDTPDFDIGINTSN